MRLMCPKSVSREGDRRSATHCNRREGVGTKNDVDKSYGVRKWMYREGVMHLQIPYPLHRR